MKAVHNTDRRALLRGRWTKPAAPPSITEIASVLIQTRPERLDAAAAAVAALPGTEIYSRDARGKLVAVIEAQSTGGIGELLNTISLMPDVLSATLVFQGTDPA